MIFSKSWTKSDKNGVDFVAIVKVPSSAKLGLRVLFLNILFKCHTALSLWGKLTCFKHRQVEILKLWNVETGIPVSA